MRLLLPLLLLGAVAPVSAQPWLNAGLTALRDGREDVAAARFGEGAALDPADDRARLLLAVAEAADDRARTEALDRALREVPDNAVLHEVSLAHLRHRMGEVGALSATDTRRARLAQRLLALDPASALGHEELALRSFLDYEWRRRNASRRGLWTPDRANRTTRAAFSARDEARAHLDAALDADPAWAGAHRLRMRLAAFDADPEALAAASEAARRARPDDPWAHLYVGLAAARGGRAAEAEVACRLGAEGLPEAERAALLSPVRFARADEQAAVEADSAGWAERFWRTRDGRLLTSENERWIEHCARLVTADLLFGQDGVRGWDTPRGDTVARYGMPDLEVWWLAHAEGRYLAWAYDDFTVTFHDWTSSGDYQPASSAHGEDDATRLRSRARTVGESGRSALMEPTFDVPLLASAFRTPSGETEWVIAYGVPVEGDIRSYSALRLQTGVFLQESDGQVAAEWRREARPVSAASVMLREEGAIWADAVTIPDVPEAALVVEAGAGSGGAFGRSRMDLPGRSFEEPGLTLSDLLLAVHLDVSEGGPVLAGHVRRGEFVLQPSPTAAASTTEPLVVYAEAYGLRLDGGRTRFDVEAVLAPDDQAGALARLARRVRGRRPPPSVSMSTTERGTGPDDAVALTLDVRDQAPGAYVLTLRIRDLVSGETASSSRSVRLEPPLP